MSLVFFLGGLSGRILLALPGGRLEGALSRGDTTLVHFTSPLLSQLGWLLFIDWVTVGPQSWPLAQ